MLKCLTHEKEMQFGLTAPSMIYGIIKCNCCHIEGVGCKCQFIDTEEGKALTREAIYRREYSE